ncbi:MAG: thiol reductant ABC exporter subunit CydD [Selenomonadaceae bacterium]|nr:thiol reductant ABC exporter subunit CydD [Selenomonadaceae bacterium]
MDLLLNSLKGKAARHSLWQLAGLKAAACLCFLLAAWEITAIIDGVSRQGYRLQETAPDFLALFLSLSGIALLDYGAKMVASRLAAAVCLKVRRDLQQVWLGGDSPEFCGISTGKLLTLTIETVDGLADFFGKVVPQLVTLALYTPLIIGVAWGMEPWTALLMIVTLPIAPLLLYLIGRTVGERSAVEWQKLQKLHGAMADLLRGMVMLKIFRVSAADFLADLSRDFAASSLRVLRLAFVSAFALELITTLSIALVAVSIGFRLLAGELDFFTAFFVLLAVPEFYRHLRQSGIAFHAGISAKTAAEKISRYLSPASKPLGTTLTKTPMPPKVTLQKLSCRYPKQLTPTLQNISVVFPAGEVTVLRGDSGSGKSTLLKMLAGLIKPSAGEIYLNDLPLGKIQPENYFRHVAYVPQEPHLFNATLRDNICLFQPERAGEETAIMAALDKAGLTPWFQQLPRGLNTELGQSGILLSNGERRRLGLARAFWQDKPLLLLDEVTAGLDEKTEALILTALQDYAYRRTVIFASHRPAVWKVFPRYYELIAREGDDADDR